MKMTSKKKRGRPKKMKKNEDDLNKNYLKNEDDLKKTKNKT